MDSQRIAPRLSKDSKDAQEARAALSSAKQNILSKRGNAGLGRKHDSAVAPRASKPTAKASSTPFSSTSKSRAGKSVPSTFNVWSEFLSSSDDEECAQLAGASTAGPRPPPTKPPAAKAPATTAHGATDSDNEMFDEFFAKATSAAVAAARSKQHRATSPENTINGGGRQQGSGGGSTMDESTGKGASGRSSPRGTATKRRREEENAAIIRRKPSPPRRAKFSSDSSSDEGVAPGVEPRRRTKAPGSNHGPDGGTCNSSDVHGFSSPRAASLGGDACSGVGGSSGCNRHRSELDTDDSFSDGGGDDGGKGGGGSGSRKRKPPGESSGDEMQVGFDSYNDDELNCAGQRREGGQNVVAVGGEEEETDDDLDGEGDGLKPMIRNPPFEDPAKRPLVLANEAGGERAEVPAWANRYLQDYQREGVRIHAFPLPERSLINVFMLRVEMFAALLLVLLLMMMVFLDRVYFLHKTWCGQQRCWQPFFFNSGVGVRCVRPRPCTLLWHTIQSRTVLLIPAICFEFEALVTCPLNTLSRTPSLSLLPCRLLLVIPVMIEFSLGEGRVYVPEGSPHRRAEGGHSC